MSRPVLFYSPNCKYSIELWNKLKQSKKLNMIIKINVNKTKNIPKNIQSVPTLLVKGRPLLTGNSIELFLNSYSENVNVNNVVVKDKDNEVSNGIEDYMPGEMGSSWSDSYSYIGKDIPIIHSYSFLNPEQLNPQITNVTDNDNKEYNSGSRKNNDLAKRLEEFKNARDIDFTHNRR